MYRTIRASHISEGYIYEVAVAFTSPEHTTYNDNVSKRPLRSLSLTLTYNPSGQVVLVVWFLGVIIKIAFLLTLHILTYLYLYLYYYSTLYGLNNSTTQLPYSSTVQYSTVPASLLPSFPAPFPTPPLNRAYISRILGVVGTSENFTHLIAALVPWPVALHMP